VELGDLREGILPGDLEGVVGQVLALEGLELVGIGTNLQCLSGIIPTATKMRYLNQLADRVQRRYGLRFRYVSAGNSANHRWICTTDEPGLINHVRVGEAILLGRETVAGESISRLHQDAFSLVAEVIECRTKPSRPYGEIGRDAFGRQPRFRDRGLIRRAILALGEQDVPPESLLPPPGVEILGACSDQLVIHAQDPSLRVGSEVRFGLRYGALLRAMTSPYVAKVYYGVPLQPRLARRSQASSLRRPQPMPHVDRVPIRPTALGKSASP